MKLTEDSRVISMLVADDESKSVLTTTENGFGKRTLVREYRKTHRGAKGVKTIALTEAKGVLAGAFVVREHHDLVFISREGMVQRTAVEGINRYGRAAQGVKVMNVREDDVVSAVAVVADSGGDSAAHEDDADDAFNTDDGEAVIAVDGGEATDAEGTSEASAEPLAEE